MKVFEVEQYWIVSKSKDDAKDFFLQEYFDGEESEDDIEITELSDKDLDRLTYYDDLETMDTCSSRSFKDQLEIIKKKNGDITDFFCN